MKGCNTWSYAPYRPLLWDRGDIYVSRLAPGKDYIHLEWLDAKCEDYEIFLRTLGEGEFVSVGHVAACGKEFYEFDIAGLDEGKDYEFHRYDGAGHGIWYYHRPMYRQEQAMDSFNKVLAFFEKHLK